MEIVRSIADFFYYAILTLEVIAAIARGLVIPAAIILLIVYFIRKKKKKDQGEEQ